MRDLSTYFSLNICLFVSVELVKNAGPDKYKYIGYSIGFDSRSEFSFTEGSEPRMSLFLELIWSHLCILIIRTMIY